MYTLALDEASTAKCWAHSDHFDKTKLAPARAVPENQPALAHPHGFQRPVLCPLAQSNLPRLATYRSYQLQQQYV